jgi:hypothetical protein
MGRCTFYLALAKDNGNGKGPGPKIDTLARENSGRSYFFNRQPATKQATAASNHSMRHIWMACQSSKVRTLKNTLTAKAPTMQKIPRIKATTAGLVSSNRSASEESSARPGISKLPESLSSGRLTPQAWQYRELTMYSVPQRQAELRSGITIVVEAGIGACQKSCGAGSTTSAIEEAFCDTA